MGITGVPGFLESIVVPPAALSRSRMGLVEHWHHWKASGHMAGGMAFGSEPVRMGTAWQPHCGS